MFSTCNCHPPASLRAQVLIPHFTGDMIDIVVESGDESQFRKNSLYLVLASISCATFSGIRCGVCPACRHEL